MAKRPKLNQDSNEPEKQKENKKTVPSTPYPIWARIVVALVLTGWLAFLGVSTYFGFGLVQLLKEATDPVLVARDARQIAQFPEPLPAGFKYTFTGIPFNYSLMTLAYVPDATVFVIGTKPTSDLGTDDAVKLVDNPKDFGLPNVYGDMKIEQKGELDLDGKKMQYVAGSSSNGRDHSIGCFIGCVMMPSKDEKNPANKNALIVYAVTPGKIGEDSPLETKGVKFNLDAAKKLFASIKGF